MNLLPVSNRLCPECKSDDAFMLSTGTDFEYHTCDNAFFMVKCKYCDLAYLNPIPTPEGLARAYPPSYKPYHFNTGRKNLIMQVRDRLEGRKATYFRKLVPEQGRILDVGCGDGRYLGVMARVNPAWRLEGVDFNPLAVNRARQCGFEVQAGQYETLALGHSQYDLINMNQVIEHVPDPGAMVEKAWKELKPGGILNVETPSLDGWDARLFADSYWGGYHFPRHLTLFTAKTLGAFLKNRGFSVVRTNYMLSPVFWVFSWHHWWEAKVGFGAAFFSDANPVALGVATGIDLLQMAVRGKTSNMRIIARKQEAA
jgi:2-polyprenyl-3-methyl-5-hydroxy-6-metoxy-1,4-benzoquinol methylase